MLFTHLIIACILGISGGIITGLVPGVHLNLVSVLLVSVSPFFLTFTSPIVLGAFIIAMAVTHTFLDAIPSIFLGAPDSDMVLGVLPGHRMLLDGMGYEAVKLTVIGSLLGLIACVITIPFLIPFVPPAYNFLKGWIGWILIAVIAYMIIKEATNDKRFWSFVMFMLTGILGLIVLNTPNLNQPLLPMLSGLFGTSMLIVSLSKNTEIPKQRVTEMVNVSKKDTARAITAGTISGNLVSFFPGLGPAQAAILSSQVVGELEVFAFLILVGSINTVNMVFSLTTLYTLNKARNGAIIALMQIIESITMNDLITFIAIALIAGGIATFLTLWITKAFANVINKVNYRILGLAVIIFIFGLVFYFSSWMGLLVLVVATAMGIIPNILEIKRSHSMGCLLLPVILYFII